ncbi:MAG: type III pantothenate kinase [Imperialibacter sp.]|uniref:type III pantothenate kinase n=1 Tax=Imperialibacter sp. TaxID=2038411 RepID=UPI0032EC58E4
MELVVDIGNSDVVFGLFTEEEPRLVFRTPSQRDLPASEYEKRIRAWFLENGLSYSDISGIIISSVVPNLTPVMEEVVERLFSVPPLLAGPAIYKGLSLKIKNPYEIGSDLVANATAAFTYHQSAAIVVDFGTALSFTVVSAKGEILGVNIAPGIKTAMKSLFQETAQLPIIPLEYPTTFIGRDTVQAIQAGILVGYVGLVKEVINKIKEQEPAESFKVIATGGLSLVLEPLKEVFDQTDPHLTLKGLHLMYQNQKAS